MLNKWLSQYRHLPKYFLRSCVMTATLATVYPFGPAQASGMDALKPQLQNMLNSPEDLGVVVV